MENLEIKLGRICDNEEFITRYRVKNLRTGEEFSRGADEVTPSASTRKTSIMMAAFQAAKQGRVDLAAPVTYEEHMSEDVACGIFRYLTPGVTIPFVDAITTMMVLSDNVCTRMVLERVPVDEVNAYCRQIGLNDTVHRFVIPSLSTTYDHAVEEVTTTTAADQVKLLEMIAEAQKSEDASRRLGVSQSLAIKALTNLNNQIYSDGIDSRLPCRNSPTTSRGKESGTV